MKSRKFYRKTISHLSQRKFFLIELIVATVFFPSLVFGNIPEVVDTYSYRITYLGKTYDSATNQTTFDYTLRGGLLAPLLSNVSFILPEVPGENQLTGITSNLLHSLFYDNSLDSDVVSFSAIPTLGAQDISLTFLGDIQEGEQKIAINPLALAEVVTTIKGPIIEEDGIYVPLCVRATAGDISVFAGDELNLSLEGQHLLQNTLQIQHSGLPEGMTGIVPSGSNVVVGEPMTLSWTPDSTYENTTQAVQIDFIDNNNNVGSCKLDIQVNGNQKPILNWDPIPAPIACQGIVTNVFLDASASYDPEGKPLNFSWTHDCPEATLSDATHGSPVLSLSRPYSGIGVSCSVSLSISDGIQTTTSSAMVQVLGCDTSCSDDEKDLCGVCNGSNLCVDCSGEVYGQKIVDRCGVCGGNNDCVDCKGVPNGPAEQDICGVCAGNAGSCLTCTSSNYLGVIVKLDGTAGAQEKTALESLRGTKKKKKKVLGQKIHKLRHSNWAEAWSLSPKSLECSHYIGCDSQDHTKNLNGYMKNSKKMRRITLKQVKQNKKISRFRKKTQLRNRAIRQAKVARKTIKRYPAVTVNCS